MDTAQHHREQAAQARRLAGGLTDVEMQKRLEEFAREQDALARTIEGRDEEA